jgi:hypothetical protein
LEVLATAVNAIILNPFKEGTIMTKVVVAFSRLISLTLIICSTAAGAVAAGIGGIGSKHPALDGLDRPQGVELGHEWMNGRIATEQVHDLAQEAGYNVQVVRLR